MKNPEFYANLQESGAEEKIRKALEFADLRMQEEAKEGSSHVELVFSSDDAADGVCSILKKEGFRCYRIPYSGVHIDLKGNKKRVPEPEEVVNRRLELLMLLMFAAGMTLGALIDRVWMTLPW